MNDKKIPQELLSFNEAVGDSVIEEYGIYHLNINPTIGTGKVDCICFDENLTAIDVILNLKTDAKVPLKITNKNELFFVYSTSGNVSYQNASDDTESLPNLKSAIFIPNSDGSTSLFLEKGTEIRLNILVVNKDQYFSKFVNGYYHTDIRLENLLNSLDSFKDEVHIGSFNFKITEQIRHLQKERKMNDITDFLYLEGIYHLIMAYHIEQFYEDSQRGERSTSLTESELKVISEISEYIVSVPELQHNIEGLCRRAGMSPAKLQEGFKHLHGKTVLNYIRYVRLQKAESLLLNSDLNISEIVYSIGFTSRSYFCKIFKSKYSCTPKEYRKNMHKKLLKSVA
ncbi:AraC-type DNA-binding protein [Flavobacteriaceae bacterium MAR_2010_188]|nr:AraC-type DNA-binding protein [Flavobacteriaceae bacterium MAR_2010_188]